MLVPYAGIARDDLARHTGIRKARYSERSWFAEVWLRGMYVGICRQSDVRLVLTVRGVNVLDLELLWPSKAEQANEGPRIEASGSLLTERAEAYGDPATQHGFGFALPPRGER